MILKHHYLGNLGDGLSIQEQLLVGHTTTFTTNSFLLSQDYRVPSN